MDLTGSGDFGIKNLKKLHSGSGQLTIKTLYKDELQD